VIKRRARLRDHAKLNRASEVERRNHEDRQDLYQVPVARREELEIALRRDESPKVVHHAAEATLDF
tara:strand:+ start:278 stop:475 length:198 start_codon:yes stop_codon:yes gene_type:complete